VSVCPPMTTTYPSASIGASSGQAASPKECATGGDAKAFRRDDPRDLRWLRAGDEDLQVLQIVG